MNRIVSVAAACAASLLALAPVAVAAQGNAYYTATPAEQVSKASLITRGTLWKCTDGVCSASKSSDRPSVMCELVVQRVGALSAFAANGSAFAPEALAKCNARAK